MLRKVTEKEFNKYIDFAYNLAINKEKCSYPVYYDGIKTKKDFYDSELESFNSKTSEILLFIHNNNVEGWINYYFIKKDKYIQISTFSINNYTFLALSEFIDYIKNKFKGYELYLGFPEDNIEAITFLSQNAELIEKSYNNVLFLNDFKKEKPNSNIIKIEKENYHYFEKLHIDKDLYWTSDRIYKDLDNWNIYLKLENNNPVSTIFTTKGHDNTCEVFGYYLEENNKDSLKELINSLVINASKNIKYLIFFEEDDNNQKIIKDSGFKTIGIYKCFKINI